ncbi:MAG: hypothetical protein Q4F96_02510 [Bacillota bacterium]|nr:hypothetical protein [Bacillota bacterium]
MNRSIVALMYDAEWLIRENRANFAFRADYNKGRPLEKAVMAIIDSIAATERLKAMEG